MCCPELHCPVNLDCAPHTTYIQLVHCLSMQVTFYGLKTEAIMAAQIFEEAYNTTESMGMKAYKGSGRSAILEYRCSTTQSSISSVTAVRWPVSAMIQNSMEQQCQHAHSHDHLHCCELLLTPSSMTGHKDFWQVVLFMTLPIACVPHAATCWSNCLSRISRCRLNIFEHGRCLSCFSCAGWASHAAYMM